MTNRLQTWPDRWCTATGKDAFEVVTSGSRGWAQHYSQSGAKFIRVGNLDHDSISLDLRNLQRVQPPVGAEGQRTRLQGNDLLISITAELCMVAVVPYDIGEAYINQHIALARPRVGWEPRFLAWYFASEADGKRTLKESGRGGTKVGLGLDDIRNAPIPAAPLQEQQRIADKLDTVLTRVDAVNTRLARVAPVLKRFRQSVLAAATSGRLTEDWREQCEAESCRTFALSDLVVSIDQGWSPKCEANTAPPDRWAVIKTTAIQALHFYPEENKALPNDLDPRPNLAIADGDVLITRAGPRSRAGIACVVKGDHPMLMLCDKAYRIRVDHSKVLPQMLNLHLNSPEILEVIDGMKTGISESGVNLTQAKFRELALSVPRIAEQAEIVRRVETLFAFADRLETRLHAAQAATERMTPALLAKAFRGELVPQDSNDEPASELLRRLQQEAPSTNTRRRRKSAA